MPQSRKVFGSESAFNDELLYDCFVTPVGNALERALLRGRWGTGKTAILLTKHRGLTEALDAVSPAIRLIWYRDEEGLDFEAIYRLKQLFGEDISHLKRLLQNLWEREIVRVIALQLSYLSSFYGSLPGFHWEKIRAIEKGEKAARAVWSIVPDIVSVLVGREKGEAAQQILEKVSQGFEYILRTDLQLCLEDIKEHKVQPVVAFEPIETPTSQIEQDDPDLAQLLITSLIDLYTSRYELTSATAPSRQLIRVEISVPWHRAIRERLREPQKLAQNEAKLTWTRTSLRSFINTRIEWEFKHAGRQFSSKGNQDAWAALFGNAIENEYCRIEEDLFSYFLRHTHYRARDLQRLARETIDFHVDHWRPNTDRADILLQKGGLKLVPRVIRASVRKTCMETAKDRVIEGGRRFRRLKELVDQLHGIDVPFSQDELKKRIERVKKTDLDRGRYILWSSGIIGIELSPRNPEAVAHLNAHFGSACGISYRTKEGEMIQRWYLFEYNTEETAQEIVMQYTTSQNSLASIIDLNIILHPSMFEYLGAKVAQTHPIGV